MRVTIHQPDLLPYSGFWFKMATSDTFVLSVHDQFQKHGYQRRVKMRGAWCSHQLVGKPSLVPITSVEVADGWQRRIADVIVGRSRGRGTSTPQGDLVDAILASEGRTLDEVNIAMIEIVREMLGIETPLVVTEPPVRAATERLVEQVRMVGGTSYVAGQGGRAYMGDDPEATFEAAGLELVWSDHERTTDDSIVTVLMDEDVPMDVVMRRGGVA